ncbi:uncharacterized protein [Spinacia oleracea]|uniref:Uncharacterized protein isoform X4 n=1 Tax=Spinacia oleracea TaxID=3562 RepID=A0ABM3QMJ7_SPIOL|nr:uncharacterized protein LOC110780418 isoform X4 [Spinacia oleracea]
MQNCSYNRRKVSWSDLPQTLLQCIVKFLGNDVDSLRRFRSVCKNWRQSTAYSVPPSVNNNGFSSSVILLRPRGDSAANSTPWMVFSVNIAQGNTLFFHPFSGTPLVNLPPTLNFSQFHASYISDPAAYHKADISGVVDNLSALFSHENLQRGSKSRLSKRVECGDEQTDDIVKFRWFIYSVDRKGNIYFISSTKNFPVSKTLCSTASNEGELHEVGYRKRLVTTSSTSPNGKLYLVAREKNMLKIFECNNGRSRRTWSFFQILSFGGKSGHGLVLFATRDYSFFVPTEQFPGSRLKDCIVFTHDAFPPYSGVVDLVIPKVSGGIYICKIGRNTHSFIPICSYPGFPLHLCSPPSWVFEFPKSQSHRVADSCNKEKNGEKQPVQSCQDGESLLDSTQHECAPPLPVIMAGKPASSPCNLTTPSHNSLETEDSIIKCKPDSQPSNSSKIKKLKLLQICTHQKSARNGGNQPLFLCPLPSTTRASLLQSFSSAPAVSLALVVRRGWCFPSRCLKETFKVYQLSMQCWLSKSWNCVEVQSFGNKDGGLVLFVTRDYIFFASAEEFPGCQLRNCIVFTHDAFPSYSGVDFEIPKDKGGIYLYQLGGNSHAFMPISSYPGFPLHLCSPPSWVFQVPPSQSHRVADKEKNEEKQPVQSCEDGASLQERTQHECAPPFEPEPETQISEISAVSADEKNTTGSPTMNAINHLADEDPEISREDILHSVSRAYITSANQSNRSDSSTIKFEGLDIKPSLVPTLQKIWSKHGNIIEDSVMCNGDMIARALESLATMVLILEGNSVRSLSDCQVDYLSSALSDLKCMRFKVDWLIPCVEKAVGLYKSKPVIETLNKLSQLEDQAKERRSNLLAELDKLDGIQKELKEDKANLSKMISFSGEVDMDLDIPLGGGLS